MEDIVDDMVDLHPACPYCGEPIDYCHGHGEIGDPEGYAWLKAYYENEEDDRSWISKEIDRQTEAAEKRGDPLPILSGMMNAFFGKP